MRILVVDDELVSRKKLEKILSNLGECTVVDSGSAALEAFKASWRDGAPFNLITLDILMPEMDGTEALFLVKQAEEEMGIPEQQRTKIVMVTSMTDKDSIANAVSAGCDGYIMKPFDREKILDKLEEFRNPGTNGEKVQVKDTVRELVDEVQEAFCSGQIETATLPAVAAEIQQALEAPDASLNEIGDLILRDAILAARIIAMANSGSYRRPDILRSVSRAIDRIELAGTRSIVNSIANHSSHETMPGDAQDLLNKQWFHSLAVAHGAREIGRLKLFRDEDRLYLLGLTHNIGKFLLIDGLGRAAPEIEGFDMAIALPLIQVRHTDFGATMLKDWGFPPEFINAAALHEGPEFSPLADDTLLFVFLANRLACELGYSTIAPRGEDVAHLPAARKLDLGIEELGRVRDCMRKAVAVAEEALAE